MEYLTLALPLLGLVLIFAFIALRFLFIARAFSRPSQVKCGHVKVLAVVGSGGHTMELLVLLENLSSVYAPRVYVIADSDIRSKAKVEDFEQKKKGDGKYVIIRTMRSREVGQSYFSSFFTTLYACIEAISIVWRHHPDLVLCNGPGTCIPICGAAILLRIFFLSSARILYVESVCRVYTLSLSAKILYFFADRMLVQWKELQDQFPKTDFLGRVT